MNVFGLTSYGLKIGGFKAFRSLNCPKMRPANIVFSVTNLCNSRCRTCAIWDKYRQNPPLARQEMTTGQWLKTWKSIGKVTFVTFTGGEPFLREDVLELLNGLYFYCRPKILNICHNGLMPRKFGRTMTRFLEETGASTSITVNLSLDGLGQDQDRIRGVEGHFTKTLATVRIIKRLQKKYPHLNLGIHTVISKWNFKEVPRIAKFVVDNLRPDSYIMEPAEERMELGTKGRKMMPGKVNLGRVFRVYASGRNHTPVISLVRNIYLDHYIKGSGLPCYAGFNHCQVTAGGNVWLCCILADSQPLGNLKAAGFDFKKVWFSPAADDLRQKVKRKAFKECHNCYLACAANTSIPQNLTLLAKYWLRGKVGKLYEKWLS